MTPGSIYKNKRHHPDRVFFVTKVKNVKVGGVKTQRIYGIKVQSDSALEEDVSYLLKDFDKEFPLLMFAP